MIDAILTNTVLPRISREYLEALAEGRRIGRIGLAVESGDFRYDFDTA
jgi:type VI secretion system protein VasG